MGSDIPLHRVIFSISHPFRSSRKLQKKIAPLSNEPKVQLKAFLLLEILISILLVSICLVPIMQSPMRGYQKEMRLLEEMEGERLAEWTFSEVKEKLLKHEIPWEKIPSLAEKTHEIHLPSMTIDIPGCKPKKIERTFTLYCHKTGEKMGPRGEIYRILHVDIHFFPRLSQKRKRAEGRGDYSYKLVVQRI